jgi:hypothetical protein
MYPEPGAPHHAPHFHARYAESAAVYGIGPLPSRLAGQLPKAQEDLVFLWAQKNRPKLLRNWMRLQQGKKAFKIPPLP